MHEIFKSVAYFVCTHKDKLLKEQISHLTKIYHNKESCAILSEEPHNEDETACIKFSLLASCFLSTQFIVVI